MAVVLASISQRIGLQRYIYTKGYFANNIAGLIISSNIEYLSVVYIRDYRLGLYYYSFYL